MQLRSLTLGPVAARWAGHHGLPSSITHLQFEASWEDLLPHAAPLAAPPNLQSLCVSGVLPGAAAQATGCFSF